MNYLTSLIVRIYYTNLNDIEIRKYFWYLINHYYKQLEILVSIYFIKKSLNKISNSLKKEVGNGK